MGVAALLGTAFHKIKVMKKDAGKKIMARKGFDLGRFGIKLFYSASFHTAKPINANPANMA